MNPLIISSFTSSDIREISSNSFNKVFIFLSLLNKLTISGGVQIMPPTNYYALAEALFPFLVPALYIPNPAAKAETTEARTIPTFFPFFIKIFN